MILRAENLMKSYSGKKVVKDVSLQLKQGEIVGLLLGYEKYWLVIVTVL